MPIHDWTKVPSGIFHHFHHGWVETIARALNAGVLPPDYYAMAEQKAVGFGPDVLTLQGIQTNDEDEPDGAPPTSGGIGILQAKPRASIVGESDMSFYRRKQGTVAVRHVSGDRVVALVEVVSPSNKNNRNGLRAFVEKAAQLLDKGIHLLILDLHPPGKRDPQGIHGAIWEYIEGELPAPPDKPLTLASYEAGSVITAYVEPVAVGEMLPDRPLFLMPGGHVTVPLEKTYLAAWEGVPARWRKVIDPPAS